MIETSCNSSTNASSTTTSYTPLVVAVSGRQDWSQTHSPLGASIFSQACICRRRSPTDHQIGPSRSLLQSGEVASLGVPNNVRASRQASGCYISFFTGTESRSPTGTESRSPKVRSSQHGRKIVARVREKLRIKIPVFGTTFGWVTRLLR